MPSRAKRINGRSITIAPEVVIIVVFLREGFNKISPPPPPPPPAIVKMMTMMMMMIHRVGWLTTSLHCRLAPPHQMKMGA